MRNRRKKNLFLQALPLFAAVIFVSQTQLIQAAFNPSAALFMSSSFAKAKQKKKAKEIEKKKPNVFDSQFVKKIIKRQAKRRNRLTSYKEKGLLGEGDNGLLVIRKLSKVSRKYKKKVESLLKDENSDREKLYAKLISVNAYNKNDVEVLRFNMFKSYLALDSKGIYYFRADAWQKK